MGGRGGATVVAEKPGVIAAIPSTPAPRRAAPERL